jgi:hypothetical protein
MTVCCMLWPRDDKVKPPSQSDHMTLTLPAEPSDRVRYLLKRMALELDTSGELQVLATAFAWHPSSLSTWIARGWVPLRCARALHLRFSERVPFAIADLCPDNNEA